MIELVKRWGDPRLIGFLIYQLRANSNEPYRISQTMNTIAEILDDKQISSLAEKYNEIAYEDGASEVQDAQVEQAADEAALPEFESEPAKSADAEDNAAGADVKKENTDDETKKAVKITYKQLRDQILQKFLIHCEQILAAKDVDVDSDISR